jgi:hypothetical protein
MRKTAETVSFRFGHKLTKKIYGNNLERVIVTIKFDKEIRDSQIKMMGDIIGLITYPFENDDWAIDASIAHLKTHKKLIVTRKKIDRRDFFESESCLEAGARGKICYTTLFADRSHHCTCLPYKRRNPHYCKHVHVLERKTKK